MCAPPLLPALLRFFPPSPASSRVNSSAFPLSPLHIRTRSEQRVKVSPAMDPSPEAPAASTTGRKGQGGSRLGLKQVLPSMKSTAGAAPTESPSPSPMSAPSPSPMSTPSSSPSARPLLSAPMSAPAVHPIAATSSSPAPMSAPAPRPLPPGTTGISGAPQQEAGWPQQQAPNPWVYPPGGFLNFIQQPHYTPQGENFHLVGQPTSFNPISPPPLPSAYGAAPAVNQGSSTNEPVNIDIDEDDNNVANRAVKKRYWSYEEEERPASSWLNASKDPVKGNDKKGDTFWKEVTDEFNKKGNGKRTREINQLKVHWSRLKASINDFIGFWSNVTKIHTSGYSDDMLEAEAQKMYKNKFGKPFSLVHWWRILKGEPKWCAQFQETDKNKCEVVDVTDGKSRPIGREAGKAERSGKRKKENVMEGIVILGDNIEKIIKVQQDRKLETMLCEFQVLPNSWFLGMMEAHEFF